MEASGTAQPVWYPLGVRILVDYRPALRERTGVGEYMHELARAVARTARAQGDEVAVFTSSWRDRPAAGLEQELGAAVIDRRIPVHLLNYLWHRAEWPPVEWLTGPIDVVQSAHPLLIPARRAARVITVHDLFFLTRPERTRAEIRRDYAELAPRHARAADAIVTPSRYTATLVERTLGVPSERIHVASPGAPQWRNLGREGRTPKNGYVLFVGTLEPRKNVSVLLDAFSRLVERGTRVPALVIAGRATPDSTAWLEQMARPPLAGRVEHRGYVPAADREALYAGARVLVMPSLDEGFGIPVLEAMSAGIPVIAARAGALPEVLGDAGPLVDPRDPDDLAAALAKMLDDEQYARECAARGLARAREFSWEQAAQAAWQAYRGAVRHARARRAS